MSRPPETTRPGSPVTPTGLVATSALLSTDPRRRALLPLGEGGMGVVERVEDRWLGRTIAQKSERPAAQGRHSARFLREARVQGRLEHPAVVPVYDVGRHPDGRLYFDMKEVRGADLATILAARRSEARAVPEEWSLRRLLGAFVQVCNAVHFAHQRGVVHRDLKPANVMLGELGEVYVLDWGIAQVGDEPELEGGAALPREGEPPVERTDEHVVLGTPGYLAPERVRPELGPTRAEADLYALGAILFEVLTDEKLHPAATTEERLASTALPVEARVREACAEAAVPPELEAVCVEATRLAPRDRPSSAKAIASAIEHYLDGDRDATLRRKLAGRLAADAQAALERGSDGRAEAAQLAGRALALDPSDADLQRLVARIFLTAPTTLPPEVEAEQAQADAESDRRLGRNALATYLAWLPLLGLIALGGVRWPRLYVVSVALALVALLLTHLYVRAARPSPRVLAVLMVLDGGLLLGIAAYAGSLVLLPSLATTAVAQYLQHPSVRWPRAAIAMMVAPMLIAFALELSGVWGPRYLFGPEGLTIVPLSAELSASLTLPLVLANSVLSVVVTGLATRGVAEAGREAQRRLRLQRWHLAQLLPPLPPA